MDAPRKCKRFVSSPAAATSHWILLSNDGVRSSKILIRDESFGLATSIRPRGIGIQTPIMFRSLIIPSGTILVTDIRAHFPSIISFGSR